MSADDPKQPHDGGAQTAAPVALDVIRPDMSKVERQRRRRKLLWSMSVTLLLTFGWIGALIAIQVLRSTAYNFDKETRLVLERIRDNQADLVFEEASPLFQETLVRDRLLERAHDIRSTLGGFRDILAIKRVETTSGPGGEAARVKATLEFDRARTTASFSFHYKDDEWKLLGFDIEIPEELHQEASSKTETQFARTEPPKEVYALTRHVLEQVRGGGIGKVWDESAYTFRLASVRTQFIENQRQRDKILGKYVRILDTMSAWRNESRTRTSISMLVEYEKVKKTTVVIGFRKREGQWRLSYYKVEIPLPKVPTSSPERPEW